MFKFELGSTLKDKITGFQGIAMVRAEYYTGCVHYGLQAKELKDGSITEWAWIDSSRLVLVEESQTVGEGKPTSSPHPNGPQM